MPKYTRMDSADRPGATVEPTPNRPIATGGLALWPWQEGARFGGAELALGAMGGARDLGVNLVELAPGRQSCPLHWHVREEEHFYVLEGRCVLRSGADRHAMGPGDYVCFPAGTGVAHAFENPHDEPCRLLAIGTRDEHEVAVYPESRKLKIRGLKRIVPLPDTELDYWDGERIHEPLPGVTPPPDPREQAELERRAREAIVDAELEAMKQRLAREKADKT
jgi:uncharacterized cupin superfamily protein